MSINLENPSSGKSIGIGIDVVPGKVSEQRFQDGFANVRSLSVLADTWDEHVKKATALYQACGLQMSFFGPSDPAFQEIKTFQSKKGPGLAYKKITGTMFYRIDGIAGTKKQIVPIVATLTVNNDACPRYFISGVTPHPEPLR